MLLVAALVALPAFAEELRVEGERWAVATGHPQSTAVGARVLREGGNAMDAAVAASLTLGVAEPYGSGLGGKLVMLYRDGASGEVTCIEALCPSPAATDPAEFAALSSQDRKYGYRSVCVPGMPAGLHAGYERWGSMPWDKLVAPAEQLARDGITIVSEEMRSLWAPHEEDLAADPDASRCFLVNGKTPAIGVRLPNPDLADTLHRMAESGVEDFYRGKTARLIVAAAQAGSSPMTAEDFSGYEPRIGPALAANFRGYRVYSSPPPLTGGVTVLSVLKTVERLGESRSKRDAQYIDRLGQALKFFYPRISRSIADTSAASQHADQLLSEETIAEAAQETREAATPEAVSQFDEATLDDAIAAGTTHLVVADADGNVVSLTQSLSLHFGAAVVPPGTGVVLNDSMSNFATRWKASPNYIAGGKRPRSTVSPVIATRDGLPALALGIPGGQRIPTTTIQLLVDILGAQTPIAEAFARPRFHLRRPLNSTQADNELDLEKHHDSEWQSAVREELEDRGWSTALKPYDGRYFGGGNAIQYLAGGKIVAVADPRRTNSAEAE